MKHVKIKISVAVVLSLLGISSANADLIIDNGTAPTVSNTSAVKSFQSKPTQSQGFLPSQSTQGLQITAQPYHSHNVTEKGVRIITAPVNGWGDHMELAIVLKQIVPDGWRATTENGIDINEKVSWSANNQNWIDVFGKLADQNHFKAVVDWNTKHIDLMGEHSFGMTPPPPAPTFSHDNTQVNNFKSMPAPAPHGKIESSPVKPIFTESHPQSNFFTENSARNTVVSTPSPVIEQQVWYMSADKTLRENIESWAKKAGWTVSWGAPDYRIISGFELKGDLDSPTGPIAQVVESYAHSEQPITAKILKGNKVIRIESRNYNQDPVVTDSVNQDYNYLNN